MKDPTQFSSMHIIGANMTGSCSSVFGNTATNDDHVLINHTWRGSRNIIIAQVPSQILVQINESKSSKTLDGLACEGVNTMQESSS